MTIQQVLAEIRVRSALTWSGLGLRRGGLHATDVAPDVIVSLTSYPKRYRTLHLTLLSLLVQQTRPEAVVLWVTPDDKHQLPRSVVELERHGLRISCCDDIRSYSKFIPALREYPDCRIAICDDDTYYPPYWLSELLAPTADDQIACLRTHRIVMAEPGLPSPYRNWLHESQDPDPSPLTFPTGVGGVLLEARKLSPLVTDSDMAIRLCPTADDLWLYWMGRLAGKRFSKVGRRFAPVSWLGSQRFALWRTNNVGSFANDEQLRNLIRHFGTQGIFE